MRRVKLAGIYRLTHKPSECYYIGKSLDIFSRWSNHYIDSKQGKHSSGLDMSTPTDWVFEVIEYCSKTEFRKLHPDFKGKTLDREFNRFLLGREKYHMSNYSITYALNKDNKDFAN
jgi:hypothetical protein